MADTHIEQTDEPMSPRRRFLKIVVAILSGIGAILLAFPIIGPLIGPSLQKTRGHFAKVADINDLPVGQPVSVKYLELVQDAYLRETTSRSVWIIKHSATSVTVFSPICPHLGCRFFWNADSQQFICPCHGSVFALNGKVLAGPALRPLDTLPTQITNGQVFVEWERFRPAIAEKIQA